MRVNVYAEEMTQRVELVEKDGHVGIRFYLYLPTSFYVSPEGNPHPISHNHAGGMPYGHLQGPFMHHPGQGNQTKREIEPCDERHLVLLFEKLLQEGFRLCPASGFGLNLLFGRAPERTQTPNAANRANALIGADRLLVAGRAGITNLKHEVISYDDQSTRSICGYQPDKHDLTDGLTAFSFGSGGFVSR